MPSCRARHPEGATRWRPSGVSAARRTLPGGAWTGTRSRGARCGDDGEDGRREPDERAVRDAARPDPTRPSHRPAAHAALPGRSVRARLHRRVHAARRDRAVGPDDGRPRQRHDARAVRPLPRARAARGRGPGRARGDPAPARVLPREGAVGHGARERARGAVRWPGPGPARGPGRAPGRRAQDRQRGPGQRVRRAGDHDGHARAAPVPTAGLHDERGPARRRARARCAAATP